LRTLRREDRSGRGGSKPAGARHRQWLCLAPFRRGTCAEQPQPAQPHRALGRATNGRNGGQEQTARDSEVDEQQQEPEGQRVTHFKWADGSGIISSGHLPSGPTKTNDVVLIQLPYKWALWDHKPQSFCLHSLRVIKSEWIGLTKI
jgi:hypothetical protein